MPAENLHTRGKSVMTCLVARSTLLAGVLLLAALSPARAENWPQWRGPTGDGISRETNVPTEWSATKNVAWTLKLPGIGSGTPAVVGDRLFRTSEGGSDLV